jgi:DNA-binding transcriptional LysR family regulator
VDSRISLHRLNVFCLVVDSGGVTRAAEQLLVAQPAVSAQLRSLESAVGAALFSRQGTRLVLTDAGFRVYEWARQVLASATAVERDVEELRDGRAGAVRIAASMAIGSYLLPPIMTRLRLERPGADITISIGQPAEMLQAAAIGEADFTVATWTPAQHEDLRSELLWEEPLVLCASLDGPPHADVIDLSGLTELPYVGVPRDSTFHHVLEAQLREHGITAWPHVLRLGHAEPIKQALADNAWVSFLPLYAAGADIARGRMRAVRIRDACLTEGIGLFQRPNAYLSPLKRAALDSIRNAAPARPGAAVPVPGITEAL